MDTGQPLNPGQVNDSRVNTVPGGVLPNKEVEGGGGGLDLTSSFKFGGKMWGKVRPSSPNKRKSLGSSVTTRRKSWGKVPILGAYLKFRGQNLGYLSFIFLEAKFGAPTRISEAKFGAKPPDLLIWKYPLGNTVWVYGLTSLTVHMSFTLPRETGCSTLGIPPG